MLLELVYGKSKKLEISLGEVHQNKSYIYAIGNLT